MLAYANVELSALAIDYHGRDLIVERAGGQWGDDGLFHSDQVNIANIYELIQPNRHAKKLIHAGEAEHIEGSQILHTRQRIYCADDDSDFSDAIQWDEKLWKDATVANVLEGGFYRAICTLLDRNPIDNFQVNSCD